MSQICRELNQYFLSLRVIHLSEVRALTGAGMSQLSLIWAARLLILGILIKILVHGTCLMLFLLAVYLIMRQHLIMAAAIQLKIGTLAR